jgi:pimeloyl-ACP methyl ester carboxylesterase
VPELKVDTWTYGKFNVYESGNGPVLLLVHSMAASWWSWSRSIPLVEQHFSVCAPDLLGHGKSEKKRDVVSVEHHAAALEMLCRRLGLTQGFFLAGAALGALVAMELALRKPKLVRGLLLFGMPAFPTATARSEWLADRCAKFVGPDGLAAPLDAQAIFARFEHHTPDLVERYNQERAQAGLWALHDLWAIGSYDVIARAHDLSPRTIVAYGASDPFLPGREALRQAMPPQTEHVLLEGVGHYPAWDAPDQTLDLLLRLTR